ncbi:hypothetical protein ACQEVG_18340 [Streptomyces sp. CA-135486]|uniref:hypothetical protein n=1 Tax=Streptomyces sp. CA-135486 TaxID=3240049 RepID=UPI003D8A7997
MAAGLDEYGTNPGDLGGDNKKLRKLFISGTRQLFCLRVIRPSLDSFRGHAYPNYALDFRLVAKDPQLAKSTPRSKHPTLPPRPNAPRCSTSRAR